MIYPLGLNKDVLLAATLYSELFPDQKNPFSRFLIEKNKLRGNKLAIEKLLMDKYASIYIELLRQHNELIDGKSNGSVKLTTDLDNLITSYISPAIQNMPNNAEGMMFAYKLLKLENKLINGSKIESEDIQWLRNHWNILNDENKYNINTAAVNITVLSIVGLSFAAAITIGLVASIYLPVAPAIVLMVAAVAIASAITVLASLSIFYMANTLLLRQGNKEQLFSQKLKFPFFANQSEKRSHACTVPGATTALSLFFPTTQQRLNKAVINELDDLDLTLA